MTIAQLGSRWKRLFQVIAIPGWALIAWKAIELIHTAAFIKDSISGVWNFATSPTGNIVVIVLGFAWLFAVVFWPPSHDPKTLRGRTLLLRDRMQQFLDDLGPMPQTEPERYAGVSHVRVGTDWRDPDAIMQDSAIQRARGTNLRRAKIEYGYDLHFAVEVLRIYNEFGVRGLRDLNLHKTLFLEKSKIEGYKDEDDLREIISALSRLAETKEADSTLP